jgi:hypothetical protein
MNYIQKKLAAESQANLFYMGRYFTKEYQYEFQLLRDSHSSDLTNEFLL